MGVSSDRVIGDRTISVISSSGDIVIVIEC